MDWLGTLIHIQTHLDGDLSLEALSARAGSSPWSFHREFAAVSGERLKQYVSRLRLERAAFQLLVQDVTLLQVALDCGFQSHETFSRAFRRRYGVAPSEYRKTLGAAGTREARPVRDAGQGLYSLSETRVRSLSARHLAFVRHVGPYEDVPESIFERLERWAQSWTEPKIWMGIGHDAPGVTQASKLRFDAALAVGEKFASGRRVGYQYFAGGYHAVTTHVGAYGTLAAAYQEIFPRLFALKGYRVVGLPVVEYYRCLRVRKDEAIATTEICVPVAQAF